MSEYQIIIPNSLKPHPKQKELTAALILSQHFQANVAFVRSTDARRTADFKINGVFWELKSPTGDSKRTIQNNLRSANKQSSNVVIDLRYCKMNSRTAVNRTKNAAATTKSIKKLLVITKDGKVLVIK